MEARRELPAGAWGFADGAPSRYSRPKTPWLWNEWRPKACCHLSELGWRVSLSSRSRGAKASGKRAQGFPCVEQRSQLTANSLRHVQRCSGLRAIHLTHRTHGVCGRFGDNGSNSGDTLAPDISARTGGSSAKGFSSKMAITSAGGGVQGAAKIRAFMASLTRSTSCRAAAVSCNEGATEGSEEAAAEERGSLTSRKGVSSLISEMVIDSGAAAGWLAVRRLVRRAMGSYTLD